MSEVNIQEFQELGSKVDKVLTLLEVALKEQHSIKASIDHLGKKMEDTSDRTTRNEEHIKYLESRLAETKKEFALTVDGVYKNMDRKEASTIQKVKVWVLGGVLTIGAFLGIFNILKAGP